MLPYSLASVETSPAVLGAWHLHLGKENAAASTPSSPAKPQEGRLLAALMATRLGLAYCGHMMCQVAKEKERQEG